MHYSFDRAVEYQQQWMAAGANLVLHSSDMVAFASGLSADFAVLRKAGPSVVAAPIV